MATSKTTANGTIKTATKGNSSPSKRSKRTTVSALYEILAFSSTDADDAVQQIVKLGPSKSVVRLSLAKLGKAYDKKHHVETLLRAADKMGYVFRGTMYTVGTKGRLIIPVDDAFHEGERVVVEREDGRITIRLAGAISDD